MQLLTLDPHISYDPNHLYCKKYRGKINTRVNADPFGIVKNIFSIQYILINSKSIILNQLAEIYFSKLIWHLSHRNTVFYKKLRNLC